MCNPETSEPAWARIESWLEGLFAPENLARLCRLQAEAEIMSAVAEIGTTVPLLGTDPALRSKFYDQIGLAAEYDPRLNVVDVEAPIPNERVGGGM